MWFKAINGKTMPVTSTTDHLVRTLIKCFNEKTQWWTNTQVRKTPEKQFLLEKPRFVAHGWYMIPIAPEELKSEGNMAAANNAAEEKLAENAKSAVDERMVAA